MEEEYFEVDNKIIGKIRDNKGKVIAVGTTTCRVLETVFSNPPPFTLHPSP
jgi:S-adenosylmethionine:tRNA-ribosyltransferase-isomerase (queuine synthetase)